MTVNILGTPYEIVVQNYKDNPEFEEIGACAFCVPMTKELQICDMKTYPGWADKSQKEIEYRQKLNLRHEIVHAFFYESGLWDGAYNYDGNWSMNEEMVDWIAIQGEKIYKAWQEADAL